MISATLYNKRAKISKKIERSTGSPRMLEASNPSTKARHTAGALSNGSSPRTLLAGVTEESATTSTNSISQNSEKSRVLYSKKAKQFAEHI